MMNPFADDPDFQYLALDRRRMLEEQTPYDAKTSCWVPDQKEGYIRANVVSTKGDTITVVTEKGEVSLLGDLRLLFDVVMRNYLVIS
jgi:hypothetical protein